MPGGLQIVRHCFFTGKVVEENGISGQDERLPSNPAGLLPPSMREALAKPKVLHLSRKLFRRERLPL